MSNKFNEEVLEKVQQGLEEIAGKLSNRGLWGRIIGRKYDISKSEDGWITIGIGNRIKKLGPIIGYACINEHEGFKYDIGSKGYIIPRKHRNEFKRFLEDFKLGL